VFIGAEAYGRLTEEEDCDDVDSDSSAVSQDDNDVVTDDECSNAAAPLDNVDTNCLYPQTPPELANLDSSNGSLDP